MTVPTARLWSLLSPEERRSLFISLSQSDQQALVAQLELPGVPSSPNSRPRHRKETGRCTQRPINIVHVCSVLLCMLLTAVNLARPPVHLTQSIAGKDTFSAVGWLFGNSSSAESPLLPPQSTTHQHTPSQHTQTIPKRQKPKGVFIIKTQNAILASMTVCTIARFVNSGPNKYAIRIFADNRSTDEQLAQLKKHAGGADLEVIVDTERWHQLPDELSEEERNQVLELCTNFSNPFKAKCAKTQSPIGYIYMEYWRYLVMAREPTMQQFDYFISIDGDAYFTQPLPVDPFVLMQQQNLTGIFNIEAWQSGRMMNGIQEAAEGVYPQADQRTHRYLDSPKYEIFDKDGKYSRERKYPSVWGCFYGGRIDFFRSPMYTEFAKRVIPYTYTYRTDEQPVIAAGWSLFADNDKIWYLPKHDIHLGVYHHGWIDNRQAVSLDPANRTEDDKTYFFHVLDEWKGWTPINQGLLTYEKYMETLKYNPGDDWEQCARLPSLKKGWKGG